MTLPPDSLPPAADARPSRAAPPPARRLRPPPIVRLPGPRSRRAVAVLVDEATSSVQNYVVLFAVLRYLSVPDVGRFTLAYTTVTLVEIVVKSLTLTALNVDYAAADPAEQRRGGAAAAAATLYAGIAVGVLIAAVGLVVGGPDRALFLATAPVALALVAQEIWRSYFFTVATPWRAVTNDVACLVFTVGLVAVAIHEHVANTPANLLLLLGAGTGFGFIVGFAQTRIVPAPRAGLHWFRLRGASGARVAGSRAVAQLAGRLSLTAISAISGAAALGRIAASRTLVAPATTLVTAMASYSLPEAARLRGRGDARFRRFLVGNSLSLAALVLATGAVLALLPHSVGHLLAGKNFAVAKHLLLPVVLYSTGNALQQGARVGIIAMLRPGVALRMSITNGIGIIFAASLGAWSDGAVGAAWGLALVQGFQVVTWWVAFARVAAAQPDLIGTT